MEGKVLDIITVNECNRRFGGQPLHPQASLIDLRNPDRIPGPVKFEFYAILLIEECQDGCMCCGRRYYDFSRATMVFLKPGEIFRMSASDTLPQKGRLLAFHPDILSRKGLYSHIDDYTFFSYRKEEALHLSCTELATVEKCLSDIKEELRHDIDVHSSVLVSRLIELLLDYCNRFYDRQFVTREDKNRKIIREVDTILDGYIRSGRLAAGGFPDMAGIAASVNLSGAYFADLLKSETGKSYKEYCTLKQFAEARRMLVSSSVPVREIAESLGFGDERQFCVIFRKLVGKAPDEYRTTTA